MTRVVADDDTALGGRWVGAQHVLDQARCCLTNHEPVHPHGSGPDGGTQSCRTELQPPREPQSERVDVGVGIAGQERRDLGTHVGVGLGFEPLLGYCAQIRQAQIRQREIGAHGNRVRSSTSGRGPTWPMTSAAARAPT